MTVERDHFGHKAPKLAAVLGQSASANVLIIGADLAEWEKDFADYFGSLVSVRSESDLDQAIKKTPSFDLILASRRGLMEISSDLRSLLRALRRGLAASGTFVLFAENRLDLAQLVQKRIALFSPFRTTAGACRRQARQAGFDRVEEFLPLPRLWGAEEFVSIRYGNAALPSDASRIERWLNRVGFLSEFSEGWCVFCSGPLGGTHSLLRELEKRLDAAAGDQIVLERFDLRNRGALILILRILHSGRRVVSRITTDEKTDLSVRLNAEWTERIHRSPAIAQGIKDLVPAPIIKTPLGPGMEYVEELIDGTIAWKLAGNPRLEAAIFDGMCRFLLQFNRQTAQPIHADEQVFAKLAGSSHKLSMDPETAALTQSLTTALRTRTLEANKIQVWAHGDFGYGNAIADPASGQLRGIIDWDQAREDLAGVDLLNFLIIREYGASGAPLTATFSTVADRIAHNGLRGLDARIRYEDEFPLTVRDRLELLGWVALRITQRAATYPALLARSRADVHALLRWAANALSE